jgi:cobalt-zinc-cadmium efflux system outer membrane protein
MRVLLGRTFAVFLALNLALVPPSDSRAMNLDQARDWILSASPQIKILKAEVDAVRGELTSSLGPFDLRLRGESTNYQGYYDYRTYGLRLEQPLAPLGLELFAGFRNGQGNIPVYEQKGLTLADGEWSAGLQLPLLQNLIIDSRRFGLLRAENNLRQRELQFDQSSLEQLRQGLLRFVDWAVASARLEVNRDLEQRAVERGSWLEARVKHGDLPRFELEDNFRSILQRETQVKLAELQHEQARRELIVYLAALEDQIQSVPEMPKDLPTEDRSLESLVELALKQRKDLEAVGVQLETIEQEIRLEKNRRLPKLDLKLQMDEDRGEGPSALKGRNWSAGLGLEFPLWQRNARGRVQTAESQRERTELQRDLLRQRIEIDLKNAKRGLEVASVRFSISKREYELALHLEDGERKRFKNGESSILTVNLREQATAEARLRMIETLADAHRNHLALKTLIGTIP